MADEFCHPPLFPPKAKELIRIPSPPSLQVEELIRLKSQQNTGLPPPSSGGGSFLDRFANKMESIATDVERSMNHMQQKLNDKVQVGTTSSPLLGGH